MVNRIGAHRSLHAILGGNRGSQYPPLAIGRDTIYRYRRFSAETIELCVRWYITYRLSYRDLAAMMAERDVIVSHTTIMRGVLRTELRGPFRLRRR